MSDDERSRRKFERQTENYETGRLEQFVKDAALWEKQKAPAPPTHTYILDLITAYAENPPEHREIISPAEYARRKARGLAE